jgi:striatin 1/3/4
MPITTVLACSPLEQLFSASLDSTIRVWTLPAASADPYAPYDASRAVQLLEGHTDAVWDLVMLPPSPPKGTGGKKGKARLVSIGADKTLKVWERDLGVRHTHATGKEGKEGKGQQKDAADEDKEKEQEKAEPVPKWTLSTSHKLESTPTCMAEFGLEQGKVVVGFSDGRVGIMSVEEGDMRWYGEKSELLLPELKGMKVRRERLCS